MLKRSMALVNLFGATLRFNVIYAKISFIILGPGSYVINIFSVTFGRTYGEIVTLKFLP